MPKLFIMTAVCAILIIFLKPFSSNAETAHYETQTSADYDYGQGEIISALPPEVQNEFSEQGLSPDGGGAMDISADGVFASLWNTFENEVTTPLRMFFVLTGIVILCSLADNLKSNDGSSVSKVFDIAAGIACSIILVKDTSSMLIRAEGTLEAGTVFLMTFCPVFAGILAATGGITSAGVFNATALTAMQIFTGIIGIILQPISISLLGIGIAGAANPQFKLEKLGDTVKKAVVFILSLMLVIFLGLLGLQTAVSASGDDLLMKTGKFVASNSVPIVGNAIGDALTTVRGSLDLLKNTTGTFGIIAITAVMGPILISLACYKLALSLSCSVSEIFGMGTLTGLFKTAETVMTVMLAFLCTFAVFAICSVGILLAFSARPQ